MGGGRKRKVTAKAANPVTVTSKVTLARQTEAWLSTFDWPTLSNRSLSLNPATHTRTRAPDTSVISSHHRHRSRARSHQDTPPEALTTRPRTTFQSTHR